jgi:hypothetical protein
MESNLWLHKMVYNQVYESRLGRFGHDLNVPSPDRPGTYNHQSDAPFIHEIHPAPEKSPSSQFAFRPIIRPIAGQSGVCPATISTTARNSTSDSGIVRGFRGDSQKRPMKLRSRFIRR